MNTRQHLPMLGDIVRPLPGRSPLRSGCSSYRDAVVVRVSPFALVSRGTDMVWSCTVEREDFEPIGTAPLDAFEACRKRITYSLTNRRAKREAAKARRKLGVRRTQPRADDHTWAEERAKWGLS